jgi:ankyrin repeat protein
MAVDHEEEQRGLTETLLVNKADPLVFDSKGRSALHIACYHGHIASARMLIKVSKPILTPITPIKQPTNTS